MAWISLPRFSGSNLPIIDRLNLHPILDTSGWANQLPDVKPSRTPSSTFLPNPTAPPSRQTSTYLNGTVKRRPRSSSSHSPVASAPQSSPKKLFCHRQLNDLRTTRMTEGRLGGRGRSGSSRVMIVVAVATERVNPPALGDTAVLDTVWGTGCSRAPTPILVGPDREGGVDHRDLVIDSSYDGHTNTANPPRNRKTGKESKRNKIFWRGATTGGGNSPPGFTALYQRHRAVRMPGWDVEGDVGVWVPSTSPFSNISLSTSAESSASHIQLICPPDDIKGSKIWHGMEWIGQGTGSSLL
ncbi:hypothetical protein F5876DRAFT_78373 [Lentinula aff. lateritia]|uniref:Uncharacterized protein n=1 Tax=Lentinula aff. lateritia TaxID=2804960 RepID=A0ACC1TVY1_9AGAR|nr:hypothetical protein F5876DRAFT_78373 [Lentinula aff. lateritia]